MTSEVTIKKFDLSALGLKSKHNGKYYASRPADNPYGFEHLFRDRKWRDHATADSYFDTPEEIEALLKPLVED